MVHIKKKILKYCRGKRWCMTGRNTAAATAAAKSLRSCPTLCDLVDGSPPGSPVPGILQARMREWVAISFSNAWKWKVKVKLLSCVQLFTTPWIAAHQAPPSMGFSRQEYWSGVPLPSPMKLLATAIADFWHTLPKRKSGLRSGIRPSELWENEQNRS